MPPVVVRPESYLIRDAANTGTASAVGALWSSDKIPGVKTALDPVIVANVASGSYGMVETFRDDSKVTYMVGSSLPVTADNMAYAVQFNLEK